MSRHECLFEGKKYTLSKKKKRLSWLHPKFSMIKISLISSLGSGFPIRCIGTSPAKHQPLHSSIETELGDPCVEKFCIVWSTLAIVPAQLKCRSPRVSNWCSSNLKVLNLQLKVGDTFISKLPVERWQGEVWRKYKNTIEDDTLWLVKMWPLILRESQSMYPGSFWNFFLFPGITLCKILGLKGFYSLAKNLRLVLIYH